MRKIIHTVKGWLNSGASASSDINTPAFIYVIKPAKHEHGEVQPNEQIAILRRLSSFSTKEEASVIAVFPGRPTRKVPDGSTQDRVSVRYAGSDGLIRVVQHAVKDAAKMGTAVVVTDTPEVEKQVRAAGVTIIGVTTFEKTLDAVAGPLQREGREPRPPREPREPKEPREPREPRKPVAETLQEQPAEAASASSEAPDAETAGEEPAPEAPAPAPAPQPAPRASSRRAQHEPSAEKRDKAILDLIDPL